MIIDIIDDDRLISFKNSFNSLNREFCDLADTITHRSNGVTVYSFSDLIGNMIKKVNELIDEHNEMMVDKIYEDFVGIKGTTVKNWLDEIEIILNSMYKFLTDDLRTLSRIENDIKNDIKFLRDMISNV